MIAGIKKESQNLLGWYLRIGKHFVCLHAEKQHEGELHGYYFKN